MKRFGLNVIGWNVIGLNVIGWNVIGLNVIGLNMIGLNVQLGELLPHRASQITALLLITDFLN